jgi:hypothetical protein
MTITPTAAALADQTADAYSFDNYGPIAWRACARLLLRRGYSAREAEAILRSKWMRWAADGASWRPSWRYGKTTSIDLARFLDAMPDQARRADVAQITRETFEVSP